MLAALTRRLGRQAPATPEEFFAPEGDAPHLLFVLQLVPELAETVAGYTHVCFVDAHTGNIPEEIRLIDLRGEFQKSPFTHHLTPASCLAMSAALYNARPQAILVSVRGYEFGFSHQLSSQANLLIEPAVEQIWQWLTSIRAMPLP